MFYYSILIFNYSFSQALPIVLALCLMLLATYYAQNYAGIIGWSLLPSPTNIEMLTVEIEASQSLSFIIYYVLYIYHPIPLYY